jgi:hypothetical protein
MSNLIERLDNYRLRQLKAELMAPGPRAGNTVLRDTAERLQQQKDQIDRVREVLTEDYFLDADDVKSAVELALEG